MIINDFVLLFSGGATFTIQGEGFNNVGQITVERVVSFFMKKPDIVKLTCMCSDEEKNIYIYTDYKRCFVKCIGREFPMYNGYIVL